MSTPQYPNGDQRAVVQCKAPLSADVLDQLRARAAELGRPLTQSEYEEIVPKPNYCVTAY
jgi:hypothetical protein